MSLVERLIKICEEESHNTELAIHLNQRYNRKYECGYLVGVRDMTDKISKEIYDYVNTL
ncbi:MAG: hypothetical protein JSW06_02915 [Thermoplasmatales archaeon]|nr:MAG: hypothetical protein JSW06_02915 [Thermoplasmatales archaeon]